MKINIKWFAKAWMTDLLAIDIFFNFYTLKTFIDVCSLCNIWFKVLWSKRVSIKMPCLNFLISQKIEPFCQYFILYIIHIRFKRCDKNLNKTKMIENI